MSKRFAIFIFLGLIIVGVAEWDLHQRILAPVRKLDRFWVDFCLGFSGNKVSEPSITMVRITDDYDPVTIGTSDSQQNSAGAAQLSRLDYAAFLYGLGKINARSVAFMPTPTFESQAALNARSIYPLRDASLQLPKMTVATVVSGEGAPANSAQAVNYPAITLIGDAATLPEIKTTVIPADPDLLVNADPAFLIYQSNNPPNYGTRPRIQLVARQGSNVVPGFVLNAVARQANVRHADITINLEKPRPFIQVGDVYKIPIDKNGTMALPSHGGLSHAMYEVSTDEDGDLTRDYRFASLKVSDVALAVEQENSVAKVVYEEFEDKFASLSENLVLVGYDLSEERNIVTDAGETLSPMTATARAIATIQSSRHTVRWPIWIRAICYVLICIIASILLRRGRISALLVPFVLLFFLGLLVLIFTQTLSWIPPIGIIGLFGLMFLIGLFSSKKQKRTDEEFDPDTV